VRAGRQHWRFRRDQTVEHPNDVQESVWCASLVLSPPEMRRRHPYQRKGTRAATGGNGAKAMPKTIPKVVGMLEADLKITCRWGKRRVEMGRFQVVLVDCCPESLSLAPRKCLHAPSSPHILSQVIITC